MNARYQDPKLGRFITPDSVIPDPTNPQDLNRYSYARNNPLNNTDPTGHVSICENDWLCYDSAPSPSPPATYEPAPPPPQPICRSGGCLDPGPYTGWLGPVMRPPASASDNDTLRPNRRGIDMTGSSQVVGLAEANYSTVIGISEQRRAASRELGEGETIAERSAASAKMTYVKRHPVVSIVGEWGKNKWIRRGGRVILPAGFLLTMSFYLVEGDGPDVALGKASVEAYTAALFEAEAAAAGRYCGPAVVVCAPVFAAAAGFGGGEVGAKVNGLLWGPSSQPGVIDLDRLYYPTGPPRWA
jgi:hypothetical protein